MSQKRPSPCHLSISRELFELCRAMPEEILRKFFLLFRVRFVVFSYFFGGGVTEIQNSRPLRRVFGSLRKVPSILGELNSVVVESVCDQ